MYIPPPPPPPPVDAYDHDKSADETQSGQQAAVTNNVVQRTTMTTKSSYSSQFSTTTKKQNRLSDEYLSGGQDTLPSGTTSASSTLDRRAVHAAFNRQNVNSAVSDSEIDESSCYYPSAAAGRRKYKLSPRHTPDQKPTEESPLNKKIRHDGYEADTDDTLTRRRKSVREMAKSIQEAEDACPANKPLRPKWYGGGEGSETECESDVEFRRTSSAMWSRKSRAYVPPKWAPSPRDHAAGEFNAHERQETTIMRFNRQEFTAKTTRLPFGEGKGSDVFKTATASSREKHPSVKDPELEESEEFVKRMSKQVEKEQSITSNQSQPSSGVQFTPSKFVPGPISTRRLTEGFADDQDSTVGRIKPKWTPVSDSDSEEPSYRSIRPMLLPCSKQKARLRTEFRERSNLFNAGLHSESQRRDIETEQKFVDPSTGLVYFKCDGYRSSSSEFMERTDASRPQRLIAAMSGDVTPTVGDDVSN